MKFPTSILWGILSLGLLAQESDSVIENPYVPRDPRTAPFLEVSFSPELDTPVPLDLEFMSETSARDD